MSFKIVKANEHHVGITNREFQVESWHYHDVVMLEIESPDGDQVCVEIPRKDARKLARYILEYGKRQPQESEK